MGVARHMSGKHAQFCEFEDGRMCTQELCVRPAIVFSARCGNMPISLPPCHDLCNRKHRLFLMQAAASCPSVHLRVMTCATGSTSSGCYEQQHIPPRSDSGSQPQLCNGIK